MFNWLWRFIYNFSSICPAIIPTIIFLIPYSTHNLIIILACAITTALGFFLPNFVDKKLSQNSYILTGISPLNNYTESILTYSIPLITGVFSNDANYVIIISLIIVISLLLSDAAIPNILLRIRGYKFYRVDIMDGISNHMMASKSMFYKTPTKISGEFVFPYLIIGEKNE